MENATQATEPTITFNDKVYTISSLPADIQEFISIHQVWTNELAGAKREVFKFEAAIRGLLNELENRFKTVPVDPVPAVDPVPVVDPVPAVDPAHPVDPAPAV
jgi:hypothetical protein